ncbi:hypothetical protein Ae331Ps2_6141c [Pseudonocardia sp. Ae331_Ps2]|nr:hypothetical protein Ae331Ps2_6141c [Pseudonocardia sp. Ae331_Ps2]
MRPGWVWRDRAALRPGGAGSVPALLFVFEESACLW